MNTKVTIAGVEFKNPVMTAPEPSDPAWSMGNLWI